MKKLVLTSLAIVALVTSLFFGCKKDANNASPVVTLKGSKSITVSLNSFYNDSGATAVDPEDGTVLVDDDISLTNPNMDLAGSYTITYTATDINGNTGKATRSVEVRNDAYIYAGTYTTSENPPPPSGSWQQTVSPSTTKNNYVVFSKFANYSNNGAITAQILDVTGEKYLYIRPTPQTANGIGANSCNDIFSDGGTGSKLQNVGGSWTFSIKFTDETTGPGTGPCAPTSALPYEDTFVQQ